MLWGRGDIVAFSSPSPLLSNTLQVTGWLRGLAVWGRRVSYRFHQLWTHFISSDPRCHHSLLSRCRTACSFPHIQMPFQFMHSSLRVEVLCRSDPGSLINELRERERQGIWELHIVTFLFSCRHLLSVWRPLVSWLGSLNVSEKLSRAILFFPPQEGAIQGK